MKNRKFMQTSLGDLIVALTDATAESLPDPRDAHAEVALIVNELLSGTRSSLSGRLRVIPNALLSRARVCHSEKLAS